jgi:hypothetical protein
MTPDDFMRVLEEDLPTRVQKILDKSMEEGWWENPYVSLVVRLTKEEALPFFARWDLHSDPSGKRSWRFHGARAVNGQALNYSDIFLYLEDPTVIHPEPPPEGGTVE